MSLMSISPLDGRYMARVEALAPYFSEWALIRYRLQVEIAWLVPQGLVIDAARMKANLDRTGGLFFSEAVLLSLVKKGMARQAAYELVQKSALRAAAGEGTFRGNLGADPDIAKRLEAAEIDRCFDLAHHLRHANAIIDRALSDDEKGRTQ
jgi:adenylosuccinate lyase